MQHEFEDIIQKVKSQEKFTTWNHVKQKFLYNGEEEKLQSKIGTQILVG